MLTLDMPAAKPSRFKNRHAGRGTKAEDLVQGYLERWGAARPDREYERLTDAKAAGRILKAAAADFAFYSPQGFGLIEVKETEHEYRLQRSKVPQLPRLRRRELSGGNCAVLIYHSTLKVWRVALARALAADTPDGFGRGSWNLSIRQTFPTPAAALAAALPHIFI